jgi:hypothetical protein
MDITLRDMKIICTTLSTILWNFQQVMSNGKGRCHSLYKYVPDRHAVSVLSGYDWAGNVWQWFPSPAGAQGGFLQITSQLSVHCLLHPACHVGKRARRIITTWGSPKLKRCRQFSCPNECCWYLIKEVQIYVLLQSEDEEMFVWKVCYNPEERNHNIHCRENPKFRTESYPLYSSV